MKKKNLKIQLIAIGATILSAALMQSCGSSSTPAPIVTSASVCGYNSVGQYTCGGSVQSTAGQGLYDACGSSTPIVTADAALGGQAQVLSVTATTSTDGTGVCQIAFVQNVNYQGYRYFLGPLAGTLNDAGNSGVMIEPYDQFAGAASGAYGASSCSDTIGDSSSSASDLYGYVPGMGSYFPLYGEVESVPYDGEGNLYLGVNQGIGESGCLEFQLQLEIQRCVDVNGSVHQCPSMLQPSI